MKRKNNSENQRKVKKESSIIILGILLTVAIVLFNIAFDFVPKTMRSSEIPKEDTKAAVSSYKNSILNLNTANFEELSSLEMIGSTRAQAIINYRQQHGNFKSIEEIKNVYGIGDKIFEANKDRLTVN